MEMTSTENPPEAEKRCSKCTESKPLDEFHLCRTGTQGRAAWCKACYLGYYAERKAERIAQREADRGATRLAKLAGRAVLDAMMGRI